MMRTLLVAALAAAVVVVAPAAAQTAGASVQSNPTGVLLGIGLDASTITVKDPAIASGDRAGAGLFLQLGYGFSPHFAIYSELAAAGVNDASSRVYNEPTFGLAHLDLGGRVHVGGSTSRLRPFLQAAVGVRVVTHDNYEYLDDFGDMQSDVLSYAGGTLTVGAGADYFFTPALALHSSLQVTGGKFTSETLAKRTNDNLDIPSTTGRLNLGVNWFPAGRAR
jgi:Outer membrane protein beta-barrel domain